MMHTARNSATTLFRLILFVLLALPAGAETETSKTSTAETSTVTATGELAAPVSSDLVGRQSGRVGRVLVDDGDRVKAGQALLELESDYFELAVAAAEAELARAAAGLADAERELERKKGLVEKGTIPQALYDRVLAAWEGAGAAHRLAETNLTMAKTQLDDAVLRSPINGVVATRRIEVGESLTPMTVPFVVIRTHPLELRFQLPERYLPQVRKGIAVRAFFDPYPGETFQGEIQTVGAVIDPASRSLQVEAVLDNRDGRLRPGLFARVELDLPGEP